MFIIRSLDVPRGTVSAVVHDDGSLFFFCNMLTNAGVQYKVIGEEGGPRRPADFGWNDMRGWLEPAEKFKG